MKGSRAASDAQRPTDARSTSARGPAVVEAPAHKISVLCRCRLPAIHLCGCAHKTGNFVQLGSASHPGAVQYPTAKQMKSPTRLPLAQRCALYQPPCRAFPSRQRFNTPKPHSKRIPPLDSFVKRGYLCEAWRTQEDSLIITKVRRDVNTIRVIVLIKGGEQMTLHLLPAPASDQCPGFLPAVC